jgi:hypothetical protein
VHGAFGSKGRPASLLGNYLYASATVIESNFIGNANVHYLSNGDLLVERSTFGDSLISKL